MQDHYFDYPDVASSGTLDDGSVEFGLLAARTAAATVPQPVPEVASAVSSTGGVIEF